MRDEITNFVLNIIHNWHNTKHKAGWEGRIIRYSRVRKFKKKSRGLLIAAKIVALWYLLILSGSYLTADTGAYFNDAETISETIVAAENYCSDKQWAKGHKEQCKDNAGIGNGCEPVDDCDTEKEKDPDNPGQNPEDCGDHTSSQCSEGSRISNVKETHTSNSITLSWSNPSDNRFDYITLYKDGVESSIGNGIKTGKFEDSNLTPNTKYSYKLVAIGKNGKELDVMTFEASTDAEEKTDDADGDKSALGEEVPPSDEPPSGGEGTQGKDEPTSGENAPGEGIPPSEGESSGDGNPPSDVTSP